MSKVIVTEIQKRFSDVDVFRHVNNIHQQEYLDLGKTDYYNHTVGFDIIFDKVVLMIVAVRTSFVGQLRYSDHTYVKTWVKAIGTKSVTVAQQIVSRNTDGTEDIRTESETVLVAFDREAQQTIEIPPLWRDKMN